MRIIFAGTPDFALAPLRALFEEHDVVAVFTQPDKRAGRGKKLLAPPVKQLAEQQGIPVYQPTSLKDPEQQELINGLQADVMVVVAYGMLLPAAVLALPRLGCINIHASILPQWRGAAPIQRAIEAGDRETGVSIMQMEAGLDTGPVFQVLKTPISPDATSASMHEVLSGLGAKGIVQTLRMLEEDPALAASAQDDSMASYAKKISKAEAELNWHSSAEELHNRIRAFVPWPVAQTHLNQQRIRIWASSVAEPATDAAAIEAGTIVALDADSVAVACASGVLHLHSLQRDGSRALPAREFCNGFNLAVGDRLG